MTERMSFRLLNFGRGRFLAILFIFNVAIIFKYISSVGIKDTSLSKNDWSNAASATDISSVYTPAPAIFSLKEEALSSVRLQSSSNRTIKTIRLLGERHSGTTYLTRYLQGCFSEHQVLDQLVRKKHWFQPSPQDIVHAFQMVGEESRLDAITESQRPVRGEKSWSEMAQDPLLRGLFSESFVLYVVRDPYQWIEAMRQKPWHWPNHLQVIPKNQTSVTSMRYDPGKREGIRHERSRLLQEGLEKRQKSGTAHSGGVRIQKSYVEYKTLNWMEFVRAPLRLVDEDLVSTRSMKICTKGFRNGSISPCLQNHSYIPPLVRHIPKPFLRNLPFDVNDAIYELESSTGEAYKDPLSLRVAKIKNCLGLVESWDLGGFAVVRYEDVLGGIPDTDAQLNALVADLERLLGKTSNCPPHESIVKKPYSIPEDFAEWISNHTDWETEKYLGYRSRTSDAPNCKGCRL